jgi:hypothetical protein
MFMKRKLSNIFTGFALLFCIRGQCQSVTPSTFNVAGGSYDNNTSYLHIEWSLGESTIIDYYRSADSSLAFTNGVLQPCTDVVIKSAANILLFQANEYKLFPNTTTGQFELDFFLKLPGQMNLQLTDAMGRVLEKRSYRYVCCDRIERYDITNFPAGVYFINASFSPDERTQSRLIKRESTFRIVKTNN